MTILRISYAKLSIILLGFYVLLMNYVVQSQPCHSTCNTCSLASNQSACSSCATPQTQLISNSCVSPTDQEYSILAIIQKNTIGSVQYLNIVNYNGTQYNQRQNWQSLFTTQNNGIKFDFESESSEIIFQFQGLQTQHLGVYIRAAIVDSDSNGIVIFNIDNIQQNIGVEKTFDVYASSQIPHTSDTLTLSITMPQTQNQISQLIDFTIILHNCGVGCGSCVGVSDNCTNCINIEGLDYFLQPLDNKCQNNCPQGYIGDTKQLICLPLPCHSTCDSCTTASDSSACSSCQSPETQLNDQSQCVSPDNQNYQILQTIQASSISSSIYLTSIGYDGSEYNISDSASLFDEGGTNLMSFDFSTQVSSEVQFSFTGLNTNHFAVLVRAAIIDSDSSGTIVFQNRQTSENINVNQVEGVYATNAMSHTQDVLNLIITMPKSGSQMVYLQDLTIILAQCNKGCVSCSNTSGNCDSCQNIQGINYFLQPSGFGCKATCPQGYRKNQTLLTCQQSCTDGQYTEQNSIICLSCNDGCATCNKTADNCSSCQSSNGIDYFKVIGQNQCLSQCPDGTYGDVSNYKCIQCPYYLYKDSCILSCPDDTNIQQTDSKYYCVQCLQGQCDQRAAFSLQTSIADDGQSLVHQVQLPQGLHNSISQNDLQDVEVLILRRATRRLLPTAQKLSVKQVRIQRPNNIFVKTTNGENLGLQNTQIQINFPAGSLLSEDGIPYSSTTGIFNLNEPSFVSQYQQVVINDFKPQIAGIVLTVLSVILLFIAISLFQKKTHHQLMSFIMFLQCLGLLRMRGYPIDYYVYNFLKGFSHTQFNFIPNVFLMLFPEGYLQQSTETIAYTFRDHNLIRGLGSSFLVFLVIQLGLVVYYIIKNNEENHVEKYKYLQQVLIQFFMVKSIFSIANSLLSLIYNDILVSIQYTISQCLAIVILFIYIFYLAIFVVRQISHQLYKFNNVARAICIALMPINLYAGLIPLIILEFIFILIDGKLYRDEKINKKLYFADRIFMFIGLILAISLADYIAIIVSICIVVTLIYIIKFFYVLLIIRQWWEQRQNQWKGDFKSDKLGKNAVDNLSKYYENDNHANSSISNLNDNLVKISEDNLMSSDSGRFRGKKLPPIDRNGQGRKLQQIYEDEDDEEQVNGIEKKKQDLFNQIEDQNSQGMLFQRSQKESEQENVTQKDNEMDNMEVDIIKIEPKIQQQHKQKEQKQEQQKQQQQIQKQQKQQKVEKQQKQQQIQKQQKQQQQQIQQKQQQNQNQKDDEKCIHKNQQQLQENQQQIQLQQRQQYKQQPLQQQRQQPLQQQRQQPLQQQKQLQQNSYKQSQIDLNHKKQYKQKWMINQDSDKQQQLINQENNKQQPIIKLSDDDKQQQQMIDYGKRPIQTADGLYRRNKNKRRSQPQQNLQISPYQVKFTQQFPEHQQDDNVQKRQIQTADILHSRRKDRRKYGRSKIQLKPHLQRTDDFDDNDIIASVINQKIEQQDEQQPVTIKRRRLKNRLRLSAVNFDSESSEQAQKQKQKKLEISDFNQFNE